MAYNHLDPSRVASGPVQNSRPVPEFKLYQFFIFCVPIVFTFVLLFLFYFFYLRRRRADWSSIRMRTSVLNNNNNISTPEAGLKKEFRELLPIIVFNETFFATDTLCSVCLGEYKKEEKLQKIPACGHVFHMDCIDHWLSIHTTCPLCRLSVLSPPSQPQTVQVQMGLVSSREEEHRNQALQQV